MILTNKIVILFMCILGSCNKQATKNTTISKSIEIQNVFVEKTELILDQIKGIRLYKQKPFNGYAVVYYSNGQFSEKTGYYKGRKEGDSFKYFENGTIKRSAFYKNNKIDGQKLIYFENGTLVSESNYVDGKRDGVQKTWFENGQLAKKRNLTNGQENGLQQSWLKNGKIYVNYEAKNGRVFGLNRSNLCYSLKNEKIKYAKQE